MYEVLEDRTSSGADNVAKAGEIQSGLIVRFTGDQATKAGLDRPLRLVKIVCNPHRNTHKSGRGGPEQGEVLLVATDIMDIEPEVIALIYKNRWAIEMYQSYCLLCHRFYDNSGLGFGLVNSAA